MRTCRCCPCTAERAAWWLFRCVDVWLRQCEGVCLCLQACVCMAEKVGVWEEYACLLAKTA